jgi:hypothetical protein
MATISIAAIVLLASSASAHTSGAHSKASSSKMASYLVRHFAVFQHAHGAAAPPPSILNIVQSEGSEPSEVALGLIPSDTFEVTTAGGQEWVVPGTNGMCVTYEVSSSAGGPSICALDADLANGLSATYIPEVTLPGAPAGSPPSSTAATEFGLTTTQVASAAFVNAKGHSEKVKLADGAFVVRVPLKKLPTLRLRSRSGRVLWQAPAYKPSNA